eukprot:2894348-Rhodomonas_salina.1
MTGMAKQHPNEMSVVPWLTAPVSLATSSQTSLHAERQCLSAAQLGSCIKLWIVRSSADPSGAVVVLANCLSFNSITLHMMSSAAVTKANVDPVSRYSRRFPRDSSVILPPLSLTATTESSSATTRERRRARMDQECRNDSHSSENNFQSRTQFGESFKHFGDQHEMQNNR